MNTRVVLGKDAKPEELYVPYSDVVHLLEGLKNDQVCTVGGNGGGRGIGERGKSEGALSSGGPDGGYVDSDSFKFWDGPYC